MNKRSLLCFLLALCMLSCCVLSFASCAQKDGEVRLSGNVQVDLSGYAVVYAESAQKTPTYKGVIAELTQLVSTIGGTRLSPVQDERATEQEKEILIGNTVRQETQKALKRVKGDGFVIEVSGEKIVIAGTTPVYTMKAVEYFITKYLTNATASGAVSLHERALAKNCESICIADADGAYYTFLLDKDLDNDPKHNVVSGAVGDYRDYPCIAMSTVTEKIKQITGVKEHLLKTATDNADAIDTELSVGIVDREQNAACLSQLEGNGYGVFIRAGRVMATAWNDRALAKCKDVLLDLLAEGTITREDGKKAIVLPAEFTMTGLDGDAFVTDFPKPEDEGILLYNTQDVGDNALQYLYCGDGVSETSYQNYCNKLLEAGYTVVTQNEVEGSKFCTLVNENAEVSLYVAYNAYAHAAEYEHAFQKALRVISAPLADAALPDAALLNANPVYTKVTESSVTAIETPGVPSANGMSYIVTLEDGRFIVLDGGCVSEGDGTQAPNRSDEKLWQALVNLHEKAHPQKGSVSADNPVHIAAWIITHSHWDHFGTFRSVMQSNKTQQMKIDYILGNYPSESEISYESDELQIMPALIAQHCGTGEGETKFVQVHTGHKYYLANVELEALVTHEDVNPKRIDTSNDTCTVFRFTISNKEAPAAKPTTIIFTGDANRHQSRFMCATFGNYLQSDMVQVAHHGAVGCESDFYDTVAPTVLWWPVAYSAFESQANTANKGKTGTAGVDYKLIYETPSVKYIYVSDTFNTTLTLGVNGPEYTEIYDALTGESITYNGEQIRQK